MWAFLAFFFSSRRRHTRYWRDWSSDVCSSDLWMPVTRTGARPQFHSVSQWQFNATTGEWRGGPQDKSRKRGGEGKRGDLGGRRRIKKKNKVQTATRPPRRVALRDRQADVHPRM